MGEERNTGKTLLRGLMRRCPRCGEGALFDGYLKRKSDCAHCGESFIGLDADDGPAWLTVGATAFLVIPLLIFLERGETLPYWLEGAIAAAATVGCVLLLLPFAKGFFIAALWLTRRS